MTKSEQDSIRQYRIIAIVVLVTFGLILSTIFIGINIKKNKDNEINIVLNDGNLVINYINGNEVKFNDKDEHEYIVSVTNSSSEKVYFSLDIENVFSNHLIDVVVIDEENNEIFNDNVSENTNLFSLLNVDGESTIRYKVIFKPNRKTEFSCTLKVTNDSLTTQTFADLILLNNDINSAKTKVGSEISKNNEGLISANDEDGVTYYFRGNVDNNYVLINDLMFRIVRINGDGSVRLVLDDVIATSVPYNTNTVSAEDENPNYGNLALLENASILTTLGQWVSSALGTYNDYLASGKFCSQNSFTNLSGGLYRSDAYNRIYFNQVPSLICYGKTFNSKVGLLSLDEVTYAGAFQDKKNENYYLYNSDINDTYILTSSNYLTSENKIVMFGVNNDGSINDNVLATDKVLIRPVINLNLSAKVKGKGTLDDPYILVL